MKYSEKNVTIGSIRYYVEELRRIIGELDKVSSRSPLWRYPVYDLILLFAVEDAVLAVNQQAWEDDGTLDEEVDRLLVKLIDGGFRVEPDTTEAYRETLARLLEAKP